MVARVSATTAAAALGIYACWANILDAGHVLNPFGIMFLLLAALVWFAWEPIREGFRSAKNESKMISRLGFTIRGMSDPARAQQPRRRSTPN